MTTKTEKFCGWLERKLYALEPKLRARAVKEIGRGEAGKIWDRYFLYVSERGGAFLHKFVRSDEKMHCHPWANFSILLTGPIIERHHDGTETILKPFRPYFRTAYQIHQFILPTSAPVFTLFIHFRRVRDWGSVEVKFHRAQNRVTSDKLTRGFFPKDKAA